MKIFKYFFPSVIFSALLLLGGCTQSNCPNQLNPENNGEITLSSNIVNPPFRVQDNVWEQGDQIGVYMMLSGKALTKDNQTDILYNKRLYTAQAAGEKVQFKAGDDANKMYYPNDGKKFDLVSYYPASLNVDDNFNILVDTKDQTVLPILYANNITQVDKSNTQELQMQFRHTLSAMRFYLVDENSRPISSASFILKGLMTNAVFHLSDGTIDNVNTVENMTLTSENNAYNAIVIPQKIENTVSIEITHQGQIYKWNIPNNVLEQGKRITYRLKLNANGSVEELDFSGIITDWIEIDGGTHELNPEKPLPGEISLTVSPTDISLPAEKANAFAQITTNAASWDATCVESWITLQKDNQTLKIEATDNTSGSERVGTIQISAGNKQAVINVTQLATTSTSAYISFTKLHEMAKDLDKTGMVITEDMAIQGIVTNDNTVGMYVFKDYYFVQSKEDNSAIVVTLPKNSTVHFDRFTQITVDNIKGATLKNFYGTIQLEIDPTTVKMETGHTISPQVVTIDELMANPEKFVFQYVKFENVQFENYIDVKFYDGTYSTKRHKIVDSTGKTISMEIYKYCKFKDDIVPQGSGSFEGIINKSVNKGKSYYNPRPINKESFDMSSSRF